MSWEEEAEDGDRDQCESAVTGARVKSGEVMNHY